MIDWEVRIVQDGGMLVPKYWSEAKIRRTIDGKQVTIKRFGWSDESIEAATHHAEERVKEALAQWGKHGGVKNKFEPKVPYNGADGVPIREEIIETHGEHVITRNSYGALCINTPDVLFADIDFNSRSGCWNTVLIIIAFLVAGYGLRNSMGWDELPGNEIITPVISVFLGILAGGVLNRIIQKLKGGPEKMALRKIEQFSTEHPDWNLQIYLTPAGYRVLVMHDTFDPESSEVENFFKRLDVDPIYAAMCRKQKCFRARLTPKPWRAGIESHLKPRPGIWPISPDRMEERSQWVAMYERESEGYAACRFSKELGSKVSTQAARKVKKIHDASCRAYSDLPLA